MAYKSDRNGQIFSYKNQPIDDVIEISDDECDLLPAEEYIDVVNLEANETDPLLNDVVTQNPIDVQRDAIKPVNLEERYNEAVEIPKTAHKIIYGCSMCSANFSTAKKLFIHMRSFVESKNKDAHKCNFCQKVLCSLKRLKEHVTGMHHGSRYKCNWCTKTYVNLTCFETHKISAHWKQTREPSTSSQLEYRSISPAGFSSLMWQSSSSSPYQSSTLPMPMQDWIPHSNLSTATVYSTNNKLFCRQHPDISHCICRLV